MGFEKKLEKLVEKAASSASRELARDLSDLSRLVAAVLRSGKWSRLPAKTERLLAEVALETVYAADLADAADYVAQRVLHTAHGQVIDLRLHRDLHVVQRHIRELFDTKKAPFRGFVYIAWAARPERYVYVGKAGSNGRLNLVAHGKLANAAAYASHISLVFPSRSRAENLSDLEACIIRLVKFRTGRLPTLNQREELVPGGPAANQLEALTGFLGKVARSVNCYI
jgi:hypothetical protein